MNTESSEIPSIYCGQLGNAVMQQNQRDTGIEDAAAREFRLAGEHLNLIQNGGILYETPTRVLPVCLADPVA